MKQYKADNIRIDSAFWQNLHNLGISIQAVAAETRLPAAVLLGQSGASSKQYFSIWQALPKLSGRPDIGIELVKTMQVANLEPHFIMAFVAKNFREAIARIARYKRLTAPEYIHIESDNQHTRIEVEWLNSEYVMPAPLVDATFAFIMELGRQNTQSTISAISVSLTRSGNETDYLQHFLGCDIQFNKPHNALVLSNQDLDLPFNTYNKALVDMLKPVLEENLRSTGAINLYSRQVEWVIERMLSAGCPKISQVASELGVSARTLQRRITSEGQTYQTLLNQVRFKVAKHYLSRSELSLFEIAALLGYEDQNSFYRAFKQWEGDTPSSWRESHSHLPT